VRSVAEELRHDPWHSVVQKVAYDRIGHPVWEAVRSKTSAHIHASVLDATYYRDVMGKDFPWVTNWIERVPTLGEPIGSFPGLAGL